MSISIRPVAAALLAAVTVVACSASAPAAGPSGSPSSPAATRPRRRPSGIVHPTGATDVVLRFDEAGGFVPVEFLAAHVRYFTLYGDGTVVFVQALGELSPRDDGVGRGSPSGPAS